MSIVKQSVLQGAQITTIEYEGVYANNKFTIPHGLNYKPDIAIPVFITSNVNNPILPFTSFDEYNIIVIDISNTIRDGDTATIFILVVKSA